MAPSFLNGSQIDEEGHAKFLGRMVLLREIQKGTVLLLGLQLTGRREVGWSVKQSFGATC